MATIRERLETALQGLERECEMPYVPGELDRWGDGIRALLQQLTPLFQRQITVDHPQLYAQILKNNLDLSAHVEQMRTEDSQLLVAFAGVERLIEDVNLFVNEGQMSEQRFLPIRTRLVETGLEFVVRTRKQLLALDTWSSESIRRDTGTGD
jgi:hypothetical protein